MVISKEGDTSVIHLPAWCESKVGKEILGLLKQEENKNLPKLTIDLAETDFMDSNMIGILVTIAKSFKTRKALLSLKNINDNINELFSQTGLDILFNIETNKGMNEALPDIFKESVDIGLEIKLENIGDVSVFHLKGIMNHPVGSRYFKQQFLLTIANTKKILIDFEDLTFFDSLSVNVLLNMNKLMKETGGNLRLCGQNYLIEDLFDTLNINRIIPIFDNIEDALTDWN